MADIIKFQDARDVMGSKDVPNRLDYEQATEYIRAGMRPTWRDALAFLIVGAIVVLGIALVATVAHRGIG
jgi:hypothetical protein